jgi:hypothetical protein
MAPRILMTPTLPSGAEAGAVAEDEDCPRTAATIKRPAAARTAAYFMILEFTLFSLFHWYDSESWNKRIETS